MLLHADNVARGRQCCSMQTMLLHADNILAALKTSVSHNLWLCLIPSLQAWEWAQLLTHVPSLADVPGPVIVVWQVVPLNPTLQEHCPRLLHCWRMNVSKNGLIPRLIFFMRKSLGMRLYQQCVSLIPRPSVSCTGNETKSGCTHCCEIALNTGKH